MELETKIANDVVESLNEARLATDGTSKEWRRKEVPTVSGVPVSVFVQAVLVPFGDPGTRVGDITEKAIDRYDKHKRKENAKIYQDVLTRRADELIAHADHPAEVATAVQKALLRIAPNCNETRDAIYQVCKYLDVHLNEDARRTFAAQAEQYKEMQFEVRQQLDEQTLTILANQTDLMDRMQTFTAEQLDEMLAALERFELDVNGGPLRLDVKKVLEALEAARAAQREVLVAQRNAAEFEQTLQGAAGVCDAIDRVGIVANQPGLRKVAAIGNQAINIAAAIRTFKQAPARRTLAWLGAGSRLISATACILQIAGCLGDSGSSDYVSDMLNAISEQVEQLRTEMHERFDELEMLMEVRFSELQHEFRVHAEFTRHAVVTMHLDLRDRLDAETHRALAYAAAQRIDELKRFCSRKHFGDLSADRDAFLAAVAEGFRLSRSTGERTWNGIHHINPVNGAGVSGDHCPLHIAADILRFAGVERTGLFVDVVRQLKVACLLPDFIIAPQTWSVVALATCRLVREVQCGPQGPRFMVDFGAQLDPLVADGEAFLAFCNTSLPLVAERVRASLEDDLDQLRDIVVAATTRFRDSFAKNDPIVENGLATTLTDLLDAGSRLIEARTVLEGGTWTNDQITHISPIAEGTFRWPTSQQYLDAMEGWASMEGWAWMHPVIRALAASKSVGMMIKVTTGVGELIEVHPWQPNRARYVVHTAQNMGLRVVVTVPGIDGAFEIWSPTVGVYPQYPRSHWWAGGNSSIPYMLDMSLSPGFKKLGAPCPLDEAAIASLETALVTPLRRLRQEAKEELLRLVGPESEVSRRINATLAVLDYIAQLRGVPVEQQLYASVNAAHRYAEALRTLDADALDAFPEVEEFCTSAREDLDTLGNLIGAGRGGTAMMRVSRTVREVRQLRATCNETLTVALDPIGDVQDPCDETMANFRDCEALQISRTRWARASENGAAQLLGRSERSSVHVGRLETSRGLVPVAIKSTCIQDQEDLESLANEVRALVRVGNHPRLLGFYGYSITRDAGGEERVVLLLELGTTNLATFLQQHHGTLTADAALRICRSVIEAVRECHARGVVHQDIKAENIVMVGDKAKLADMGNASIRRMAATTRTMKRPVQAGFSASAAPEVLLPFDGHEQGHTRQSDAYSLGLLLLQIQLARHGIPLFGSADSGAPLPTNFMQVIAMYATNEDPFQLHPRIEGAMGLKDIDDRALPAIRICLVDRRLPPTPLLQPARAAPTAPQQEPPALLVFG